MYEAFLSRYFVIDPVFLSVDWRSSQDRATVICIVSAFFWGLVTVLTHVFTPLFFKNYRKLSYESKIEWCNRMASTLHALLVVPFAFMGCMDKNLLADPLNATNETIWDWCAVTFGYFVYDTIFTAIFFRVVGGTAIVIHHVMGLVCFPYGLYLHKFGVFGLAAITFMEGTNPSMNLIWQLRTMDMENTKINLYNGVLFVFLYFVFRIIVCDYFLYIMINAVFFAGKSVTALEAAGPVVFGTLCILNWFWFAKVILMFKRRLSRYNENAKKK